VSAHLDTLQRRAQRLGLQLVVLPERSGVKHYALVRDEWHPGDVVLWYVTLGGVETALAAHHLWED